MSIVDGLTELYNVSYFKLLLKDEITYAQADPTNRFSILLSDIDYFKRFNDTYGHQAGDLALKEVAKKLKENVRETDIVARYGGEEMVILLKRITLKDSFVVAEKIRTALDTHSFTDGQNTFRVTVSIGVASFQPGDNVDTIIKRADEALYKAKQTGRNKVCTVETEEEK